MNAYYRRPEVVARIGEYLGGPRLEEATCVYVARSDLPAYNRLEVRPPRQLSYFLHRGTDVGRSLWDHRSLLAHLDIEYLNHDSTAAPYLDPPRIFALQEPLAAAAERILEEYGIRALHLLTGRGRELILLDLSEYHDPLHTRTVRVPFTLYCKPWAKGVAGDLAVAGQLQTVVALPRLDLDLPDLLALRADLAAVARLAGEVSTAIPLQEEGTGRLIGDYEGSGLRRFHDWFYSQEPYSPERWSRTYDQMLPDTLPLCVRRILESSNDRLRSRAGGAGGRAGASTIPACGPTSTPASTRVCSSSGSTTCPTSTAARWRSRACATIRPAR